jgi:hypothetical protein
VYDDGGGPRLYAGGDFDQPVSNLAKWDGSSWSPVGGGTDYYVHALAMYDDGGGPALYVAGSFISLLTGTGGERANRIARWNGSSWSLLGSGMNDTVLALVAYDDGSGPALYAGGAFTQADGLQLNHLAKWDGSRWSALGSGVGGGTYPAVWTLAVYDDGHGPALYAGGYFTTAGGASANNIARWDGSSWSALGSGVNYSVVALAVYDDGRGPALYAGGYFTTAGGVAVNRIARWDGSSWSALGNGIGSWSALGIGPGVGPRRRSSSSTWPCTTTAPDQRSTPEATSRGRAACSRGTSRSGTARAGRRSAAE